MKRIAPLLLIVLVALILSAPRPSATAQDAPRKQAGWQYRVFRLDPVDYQDKQDYEAILAKEGARNVDAAFQEHVLNYLGKDGWDLVQVEQVNKTLRYLYLKRATAR